MSEEQFTDFEVDVNLEATEAWGGEQRPLLPQGDYLLTVTNMLQKTGKESGGAYFAVTFDVAEGEFVGQKVYNNYSLSDKAIGRLKSLMVACKTQLDKVIARQFVGQTIKATITHTEGSPQIDQNGNPKPIKIFANVVNELPLDDAPAEKPAAKTPAIMNKPAAAKPVVGNGAARRA